MRPIATFLLLLQLWTVAGCARLIEQVSLRAQPLEPPRTVRVQLGERMAIVGQRDGDAVRAQVDAALRPHDGTVSAVGMRRLQRYRRLSF